MRTSLGLQPRWLLILCSAVYALLGSQASCVSAQQPAAKGEQLPATAPPPSYDHIDMVTTYEVDPNWPQRPADIAWDQTPSVAVDKNDNVYMFTRAKPPVQVYAPSGKLLRTWGDDTIGKAHGFRFDDDGNAWITDVGLHVVRKFTPEGKLLQTLGTPGQWGCDAAHFYLPTDIAFGAKGDVFVADGYGNSRIAHFDRNGKLIKTWGKRGVSPGEFSLPHSIVRDSQGRLYVADRNNVRIQVFNEDGKFLAEWRDLLVPWTLLVTKNDEIVACGSSPMPWIGEQRCLGCPPKDQLIMRFDPTGKVLSVWTFPRGVDGQEKPGELNWIHGIAFDSHGNLFAGDIIGKRLQKFVPHAPTGAPAQ